ncbi:MAG: FxLYD domain-containing protein [Duncaniella sp.]|nr:FxLYD domain-containing protein [Duncaniella sp.]
MSRIISGAITAVITLLTMSALHAAPDDTRHSRSRMLRKTETLTHRHNAKADTLRLPPRDSITLSGYDKPLRTTHETLLVTNSTSRPVTGIGLTVNYLDMQGRQLHSRTDTLLIAVPPGETRMLRFPSWDRQQSYYYHLGPEPRSSRFTPYTISIRTDFITHPLQH